MPGEGTEFFPLLIHAEHNIGDTLRVFFFFFVFFIINLPVSTQSHREDEQECNFILLLSYRTKGLKNKATT